MAPARDLLLHLERLNVKLRLDQGILKCRAAPDVLTDELRQMIREHRAEIIRMLSAPDSVPMPPESVDSPCRECGQPMREVQSEGPCERKWTCSACGWWIIAGNFH